jgi:hypothetical protein
MEVHSHTHTPLKKWTHYIWEFFMLFLAVTLGFFVENQREHFVERKKEKEYVHSIIQDLKSDTAWLKEFLNSQDLSFNAFDSVIFLLQHNSDAHSRQRLYYLVRIAIRYSDFYKINDNAYEQMKSSGNLRLLHSRHVAENISKYYSNVKDITLSVNQTLLRQQALIEFEGKIFDGNIFQEMINKETFKISPPSGDPLLINEDKKIINEFIVKIHYLVSIMLFSKNFAKQQIAEAEHLADFLQKEYP